MAKNERNNFVFIVQYLYKENLSFAAKKNKINNQKIYVHSNRI